MAVSPKMLPAPNKAEPASVSIPVIIPVVNISQSAVAVAEDLVRDEAETSIDLDELCAIYRPYQKEFDPESLKDTADGCFAYLRDDEAVTGAAHTPYPSLIGEVPPVDAEDVAASDTASPHSVWDVSSLPEGWRSSWSAQKLLSNRKGRGVRQLVELAVKNYNGLTPLLFDRYGSLTLSSGVTYEGPFDEYRNATGIGRLTFKDGTIFDGYINQGQPGKQGIYRWSDGSYYEGNLNNGLRNGYGRLFSATTGSVYSGNWLGSYQHGFGKIVHDVSGSSFYQGNWYLGIPWGYGVRQWSSGNFYEGQWTRGLPHGRGVKFWIFHNVHYRGEMEEGKPHGYGLMIWLHRKPPSVVSRGHKCFYGIFRDGVIHGYGTYWSDEGIRLSGYWESGKKHGKFEVLYPNGVILRCAFVRDVLHNPMPQYLLKECREKFSVAALPGPDYHDLNYPAHSIDSALSGVAIPGTVYYLSQIVGLTNEAVAAECRGIAVTVTSYLEVFTDIHNVYSRLLVETACDNVYVLRAFQVWQFLADVALDTKSVHTQVQHSMFLILSNIEECFTERAQRGLFCHPYATVSFEEFIDRVVIAAYLIEVDKQRTAHQKAQVVKSYPVNWEDHGAPLKRLVESRILERAGTFIGNLYENPTRVTALFDNMGRLHKIYRYIFEFYGGQEQVCLDVVTLEMISTALQHARLVDTDNLSLAAFLQVCFDMFPRTRENPKTSVTLTIPVTFLEFVELTVLVAQSSKLPAEPLLSNHHSPAYSFKGRLVEAVDSIFLTAKQKPGLVTERDLEKIDFDQAFYAELRGGFLVVDSQTQKPQTFQSRMLQERRKFERSKEFGAGDALMLGDDLPLDSHLKRLFPLGEISPKQIRLLEEDPEIRPAKSGRTFLGLSLIQCALAKPDIFPYAPPNGQEILKISTDLFIDVPVDEETCEVLPTLVEDGADLSLASYLETAFIPALVKLKRTNDLLIAHGHAQPLKAPRRKTDLINPLIEQILLADKTSDTSDIDETVTPFYDEDNIKTALELGGLVHKTEKIVWKSA